MLKKDRLIDPFPLIHKLFQNTAYLVDPNNRENQETPKKGYLKFLIGTISLVSLLMILSWVLGYSFSDSPITTYQSDLQFLGIPIYAKGENPVAWIAVGSIPVGFISIGDISIGVFSFGGIALGLFSLGGVALSLIAAFGGGAIGYYAFGGLAIGGIAYAGNGVAKGFYLASGRQSETLIGNRDTD